MHLLQLPDCFKDKYSLCCMMLLLFPTKVKNKKSEICHWMIKDPFPDIMSNCYDIFQQNTVRRRSAFFKDPLMAYLWKVFIDFKPMAIDDYFQTLNNHPDDGDARYNVLVSDLKSLEQQCKKSGVRGGAE